MADAELMKMVAEGDPVSGRRFADQYQLLVYNVCYSFIRNRHDAEDVAQEVFLEAAGSVYPARSAGSLSRSLPECRQVQGRCEDQYLALPHCCKQIP